MDNTAQQNTGIPSNTLSFEDAPPSPLTSVPPIPVSATQFAPQSTETTPPTLQSAISSPADSSGKKRRSVILIAIAVLLMVGGVGAGVYLITQRPFQRSFAWDCGLYNFTVDTNGTVAVMNGSLRDEPAQKADVYINGSKVQTFDVPALNSGDGATLGTVQVPTSGGWSWLVDASMDCDDSGEYPSQALQAQCLAVKIFDEDWKQLTSEEMSQLDPGNIVRFTVAGTATSGEFTKARFLVNGALRDEVTQKRPGSDEFYDEYTIPEDVSSFSVNAQLFHQVAGWF